MEMVKRNLGINNYENLAERFSISFSTKLNGRVEKLRKYASEKNFNKIKLFWKMCNEIYPNECDLQVKFKYKTSIFTNQYGYNHSLNVKQFDYYYLSHVFFIIHFPKTTIRNSQGLKHEIKDIYVSINMTLLSHYDEEGIYIPQRDKSKMIITKVKGARTTVSIGEVSANYAHSHLGSRRLPTQDGSVEFYTDYGNFCLGTGDVESVRLLLGDDSNFTEDYIRLFLLDVQQLLEWESLEGVPFVYISNIGGKNYNLNEWALANLSKKNFIAQPLTMDWSFKNGRFYIIDNEKFEDWLLSCITSHIIGVNVFHKDQTGKCYIDSQVKISKKQLENITCNLLFKGERKFLKVEVPEVIKEEDKGKYYIHPKLKEYVKLRLEREYHKTYIGQIAIENCYSGDNE